MLRQIIFLIFYFFLATAFANQLIIEPDMGRQPILDNINQTKHNLDLVMYGMTDDIFIDAIIAQQQRGRTIKVILEQTPYKAADENIKAITRLKENKIDWHGNVPPFKLIHQKTLLIDDKKALVMTFNFTKSAFKNDRNFALVIDDKNMLRDIKNLFAADWNHKQIAIDNPNLVISPDDSREKILKLIKTAKNNIEIYTPSISDFKMIGALAKAAKDGVKIKILMSNHLREKQKQFLSHAGITIHQSTKKFIHAKVIIIDNKIAMLGSLNFTKPSFDSNRELSVITNDKVIVSELSKTFQQDWEQTEKITISSSNKEKHNTQQQIILQSVKLLNQMIKKL